MYTNSYCRLAYVNLLRMSLAIGLITDPQMVFGNNCPITYLRSPPGEVWMQDSPPQGLAVASLGAQLEVQRLEGVVDTVLPSPFPSPN